MYPSLTEHVLKLLTTRSLHLKHFPHEPQINCLQSEVSYLYSHWCKAILVLRLFILFYTSQATEGTSAEVTQYFIHVSHVRRNSVRIIISRSS